MSTNLKTQPYIEFDAATHRYFIDGRWRPSVTQILHSAGYIDDRWFDELSRWRGSEVHRLTMIEDRREQSGQPPLDLRTIPRMLRGYVKAWRRYKRDLGIEACYMVEHRVTCDFYAGTLDRIIQPKFDNHVLIDLKTNRQGTVPDYTRLQTAAYGHALKPNRWFERRGVCLKPDGTYRVQVYPASQFEQDYAEFHEAVLKTTKGERNGREQS